MKNNERRRRKNNHARLTHSDRLQKALELLIDRNWHTTLEVGQAANTFCPGSTMAELRSNGLEILCRFKEKLNGRRIYEYRLGGA